MLLVSILLMYVSRFKQSPRFRPENLLHPCGIKRVGGQQCPQTITKVVDFCIPEGLAQDHIGPSGLGRDEQIVHRRDRFPELAPNRRAASPSFHYVSRQTAAEPEASR